MVHTVIHGVIVTDFNRASIMDIASQCISYTDMPEWSIVAVVDWHSFSESINISAN